MGKYEQLLQHIHSLEADFAKFYEKGQAAAGTRLRKGLSDLKRLAQDVRNDVQKVKSSRKEDKSE
ncbi:MAG TPA: histone H1 [Bacteroidetes bacterium]|nr:histone H1 [Bacteroidota bacterium]HRI46338.1 histone H1 [Ignavibacteriaceae bacterium]